MLKICYYDNENNSIFNITSLVDKLNYTTHLDRQAGKVTFTAQKDDNVVFKNGGMITIQYDDINWFKGYIFKLGDDELGQIQITAYDQLRYLKNKDVYISTGDTLSTVFTALCDRFKLNYSLIDKPNHLLTTQIHDNKNLYDIIDWGVGETLRATKKLYIVRDNFGTLELVDIDTLKTNWVYGDYCSVTNYKYEKSIDRNTFNQIKLQKEDKEEKIRHNYIVFDSANQKKWGILQHYESVQDCMTDEQIEARADNLLKLMNHEDKELSLQAIGNAELKAGNGIFLKLKTHLGDELNQYAYITECSHDIKDGLHLMQFKVVIP